MRALPVSGRSLVLRESVIQLLYVTEIDWDAESAEHIRTRSRRYDGAVDIEPDWTREVVNDPDRLVEESDPSSANVNSVRAAGYSPSAQTVITVVAPWAEGVLHGASAWKTTGAATRRAKHMTENSSRELRNYRNEAEAAGDRPLSPSATRPGRQRVKVFRYASTRNSSTSLPCTPPRSRSPRPHWFAAGSSTGFEPARTRRSGR